MNSSCYTPILLHNSRIIVKRVRMEDSMTEHTVNRMMHFSMNNCNCFMTSERETLIIHFFFLHLLYSSMHSVSEN